MSALGWTSDTRAENPGEIFIDPAAQGLGKNKSGKDAGARDTPGVDVELLMVLENTRLSNLRADQGSVPFSQVNYLDPIIQGAMEFRLAPGLGVYALGQARSFASGETNRTFRSVDGQLLNLFMAYQAPDKDRALFGGKFDVGFGSAWHRLDGIYSGFSEDYHYQGALGAGARQQWGSGWGKHALTAIAFKRDHGLLRDTWFNDRPGVRDDADRDGLAMTSGPESGGLAYELTDIAGVRDLRLGVDAGHLAQGQPGRRSMNVLAAAADYRRALAAGRSLRLYAELVHAEGAQGRALRSSHAVLSASLTSGNTIWTLTGARRSFAATGGALGAQGIVSSVDHGVSAAVTYVTSAGPILQGGITRQYAQGLALTQMTLRVICQWPS